MSYIGGNADSRFLGDERHVLGVPPNSSCTVCMSSSQRLSRQSIRELVPHELGGVPARRGFRIQDHVATGFLIGMNTDAALIAVYCEAADDILLLWNRSGVLEPEFVQVKADEPDQLWTLPKFCAQPSGKKSIVELSLQRDAWKEDCRFRIVVTRDLEPRLEPFTREINHGSRSATGPVFLKIHTYLVEKLGAVKSASGGTLEYWLARTVFEVVHSEGVIRLRNLSCLEQVLEQNGWFLTSDQREVVYEQLARIAKDAADADGQAQPDAKKLERETIEQLLARAVDDVKNNRPNISLEITLGAAGLSPQTIRGAKEATVNFESARRTRRYYGNEDWERLEHEIGGELHRLWAEYEAGAIDDSPLQFHARCLRALSDIHARLAPPIPPMMLQGALYSRVKRGLLRFDRPSLREVA